MRFALEVVGMIAVSIIIIIFVVSPIMNWFNGYGFTIIF